jgi:hypothetical protein
MRAEYYIFFFYGAEPVYRCYPAGQDPVGQHSGLLPEDLVIRVDGHRAFDLCVPDYFYRFFARFVQLTSRFCAQTRTILAIYTSLW